MQHRKQGNQRQMIPGVRGGPYRQKNEARFQVPFKWAVTILAAESLLIPAMWLTGHRGNNSFIALCLLFIIFYWISPELRTRFRTLLATVSHSAILRRRVAVFLSAAGLFLVLMHLLFGHLHGAWDLDWEGGIGTTYSGFLLATASLMAYFCCCRSTRRIDRIAWLWFGTLLLAITIDELSEFHHGLAHALWETATGQDKPDAIAGLAFWIIVMSPFIALIVAGLAWFIHRVLHRESRAIAYAALLCWISSQALEATISSRIIPGHLEVAGEEFLEMLGTILFILTFYREYARVTGPPPEPARQSRMAELPEQFR